MSVLIKGGDIVTADQRFRADLYCADGKIRGIGVGLEAAAGAAVGREAPPEVNAAR